MNAPEALMRVVLTGSESIGKTTLAEQLGAYYDVRVVPEFVRTYAAEKGAPLDFRDHGPIAHGQMALEDRHIADARARHAALLVQDTDLVSTVTYCHHYFGRCPDFIEAAAIARMPALYLLPDIDVPWVADGVRDCGDRRELVQQLFVNTLHRFNAPVARIQGNWASRFAQAVRQIDESLRHFRSSSPSGSPHD